MAASARAGDHVVRVSICHVTYYCCWRSRTKGTTEGQKKKKKNGPFHTFYTSWCKDRWMQRRCIQNYMHEPGHDNTEDGDEISTGSTQSRSFVVDTCSNDPIEARSKTGLETAISASKC